MRLTYIDSWRAFSVFAVIISHLALNRNVAAFLENHRIEFMSGYGHTGVFVFFFISGYVVSKTLFAELASTSTIHTAGFYIRRTFRILPPLMLYLVTYLLLGKFGVIAYSKTAFVRSAFYLSNNSLGFLQGDWYTGHTWSLSFEEQFYLAFPLLFIFLQCSKRPPLASVLLTPLILLPAIYPIFWIGRTGFIVIHFLFFSGYVAARFSDSIHSALSKAPTAICLIAIFLTFGPPAIFHSETFVKFYKVVFLFSIPCAVLSSGIPANYIGCLFRFRWISYIGKISYSIYLWQQMLTGDTFSSSDPWVQLTLLVVLLVACWASYEWLEKPLIGLGRSLAQARGIESRAMSL